MLSARQGVMFSEFFQLHSSVRYEIPVAYYYSSKIPIAYKHPPAHLPPFFSAPPPGRV